MLLSRHRCVLDLDELIEEHIAIRVGRAWENPVLLEQRVEGVDARGLILDSSFEAIEGC
jgi:hypothetical protein